MPSARITQGSAVNCRQSIYLNAVPRLLLGLGTDVATYGSSHTDGRIRHKRMYTDTRVSWREVAPIAVKNPMTKCVIFINLQDQL
jgi:hypothetical protein